MASGDAVKPDCAISTARTAAALHCPAWNDFAIAPKFWRLPAACATASPKAWDVWLSLSPSNTLHASVAPSTPSAEVECQPRL